MLEDLLRRESLLRRGVITVRRVKMFGWRLRGYMYVSFLLHSDWVTHLFTEHRRCQNYSRQRGPACRPISKNLAQGRRPGG